MKTKLWLRIVLFVLILVVMNAGIPGGAAAQGKGGAESSLRAGAWALLFQIGPDFTLSNFSGATVSVKRHFSTRSALRAGLNLSRNSLDLDSVSQRDTLLIQQDSEHDQLSVGLDLEYLYYAAPASAVKLFFGAGPFFRFSSADQESSEATNQVSTENDDRRLGMNGIVGVEWFATESIGIHAEYGFSAGHQSHDATRSTGSELGTERFELDGDGWFFGPRDVLFGASFYF